MEPRISAVVNTLNEEKNLPYALRSVRPWVDEIIVVDMHSTDRTAEIAVKFGAKVYFHEPTNFVEPARASAISRATGAWILVLDADEIIPEPLSRELRKIARGKPDVDAVRIPRLNYLLGAPLQHTGWAPRQDRQLRFFRHGCIDATKTIHEPLRPRAAGRSLDLPYREGYAIVHFNYVDTSHFLEKMNVYTTVEAQQATERGEAVTLLRSVAAAAKHFGVRYFKLNGWRDGWRGFYLSLFMAFYHLVKYAKMYEVMAVGKREVVESYYRNEAERILRQYDVGSVSAALPEEPQRSRAY
jgi:glycosyltransferase involved in cell wall biosynthesis